MRKILLLIFLGLTAWNASRLNADLDEFIHPEDPRHATFKAAFALMEERGVKTIVETGTARNGLKNCTGDGCSTPLFAEWASRHDAMLYSVDIDPSAILEASEASAPYESHVHFVTGDSLKFLRHFDRPIDFLYLDSLDFNVAEPHISQEHHLREIIAVYPFLKENSIIMIDDCALPFGGKGRLVIDYLLKRGWTIFLEKYQVILVRKKLTYFS